MKRAVLAVPVVLVLTLVTLLVAPNFIEWNEYKSEFKKQVHDLAGLDLSIEGNIRLSLIPFPTLSAEKVSLKSPQSKHYDQLASLGLLSVGVDIMPLLQGEVSINSVVLKDPVLMIEAFEDGSFSFETEQIKALSGAKEGADPSQAAGSQGVSSPALSFKKVSVENASFHYYDTKTQKETVLDKVTADLRADSLDGPYVAKGYLTLQDEDIAFDIQSEGFDRKSNILSLKAGVDLKGRGISGQYAGALDFSNGFSAQGQVDFSAKNLANVVSAQENKDLQALAAPVTVQGFMSVDEKKMDMKDFTVAFKDQNAQGQFGVVFEPLLFAASVKTPKDIDVKGLLAEYPEVQTISLDINVKGNAEKMTLSPSQIKLNQDVFDVSGEYSLPNKTKPSVLDLKLKGKSFDVNPYMVSKSNAKKQSNSGASSGSSDVKMNVVFDVSLGSLRVQDQMLSQFQAKGTMGANDLKLSQLEFDIVGPSHVKLNADVANLAELSGIKAQGSVTSKDAKTLAKHFGIDEGSLSPNLTAMDGKFKAEGDMNALNVSVNVGALGGSLIAQGLVQQPTGQMTIKDLTLQVKHRNMDEALNLLSGGGSGFGFTRPLDLYAKVAQPSKDQYVLSDITADLSGIAMQGNADISMADGKPSVRGKLSFGDIVLPASKSSGSSAGSGSSSAGRSSAERWSKEPIDMTFLNSVNAELDITAKSFTSAPWVLSEPKVDVRLNDGKLALSNIEAGLFDGRMAASSSIHASPKIRQPVHITLDAKLSDVNVSKLVVALSGSQLVKASGKVSGDLDVKTSGLSQAALVYDLNGGANVSGSDIVLQGFDVERFAAALSDESKPKDSLVGLWKGATKGGQTAFDTLDGRFIITEGVAHINKLDLDGAQASIQTTGKVDLPNWSLATKHKITAKTRTDIPAFEMSFSGSLDNPAQTFGQGVLNDYLQRKIQRKVDKKIDEFLSKKLGLPSQQQTQDAPDAIAPSVGGEADNSNDANGSGEQEVAPQQSQDTKQQEVKPEDVLKDVIKGLF